jgi:hypothetical protein
LYSSIFEKKPDYLPWQQVDKWLSGLFLLMVDDNINFSYSADKATTKMAIPISKDPTRIPIP